jgi:hypothetical protein
VDARASPERSAGRPLVRQGVDVLRVPVMLPTRELKESPLLFARIRATAPNIRCRSWWPLRSGPRRVCSTHRPTAPRPPILLKLRKSRLTFAARRVGLTGPTHQRETAWRGSRHPTSTDPNQNRDCVMQPERALQPPRSTPSHTLPVDLNRCLRKTSQNRAFTNKWFMRSLGRLQMPSSLAISKPMPLNPANFSGQRSAFKARACRWTCPAGRLRQRLRAGVVVPGVALQLGCSRHARGCTLECAIARRVIDGGPNGKSRRSPYCI